MEKDLEILEDLNKKKKSEVQNQVRFSFFYSLRTSQAFLEKSCQQHLIILKN